MSRISFRATPEESRLVTLCAKRWNTIARAKAAPETDEQQLEMDLLATHANGSPLDFARLLTFEDHAFIHDVGGIRRHLDRRTGELTGHFLPRSSKPERAAA